MLKEVADEKKIGKEIVQAAIKAVKEKGWDVNPYTVADEAKVSRQNIYRDADLMGLITEARGATTTPAPASDDAQQARMQQLEERVSQLEKENKTLEDACFEREDRILELEAKCTDLEHEAETLAVQLQNTWNVAHQKGLIEGAAKARDEIMQETGPQRAFTAPVQMQRQPQAAAQAAAQPPAEQPSPSTVPEASPPETAPAAQSKPNDTVPQNTGPSWSRHLDPASNVFNVAKGGPYVASSFNPLDNLSWKDLETVYHFRVSSLKEVTKGLAGESPDAQPKEASGVWTAQQGQQQQQSRSNPEPTQPSSQSSGQQAPRPVSPPKQSYLELDSPSDPIPSSVGETALSDSSSELPGRQPPPDHIPAFGAGMHAESALDLDQMDIFEGLEDIEDLGHIDVIEDVQPSSTLYQTTGDYLPFEGPAFNYRPSPTESLTNIPALKMPQPTTPELPPDSQPPAGTISSANNPVVQPQTSELLTNSQAEPAQAEDEAAQGDKLRDLIKSRIAQAKEQPFEQSEPVTPPSPGSQDAAKGGGGMKSKFVGGKAAQQGAAAPEGGAAPQPAKGFTQKPIPPEIRKSCFVLGLRADEITQQMVMEAWKKQIATPGVHPDTGGDTEYAVHLNTAKDTLVRWLDQQGPKLGKKFGKDKDGGGGGPIKPKQGGS